LKTEGGKEYASQESDERREEAREASSCAAELASLFTQVKQQDRNQGIKLLTSAQRVSIFQQLADWLSTKASIHILESLSTIILGKLSNLANLRAYLIV
jgi:hypothetical protein